VATYAIVGTDHPGGHHTPTFDVEEADLDIAVDVLAASVVGVAVERRERVTHDGNVGGAARVGGPHG
jgi:hypothetical protein